MVGQFLYLFGSFFMVILVDSLILFRFLEMLIGIPADVSDRHFPFLGRCAAMPREFFLIYENPENHGWHGFHVIYIDCRAEWWPAEREAEFQKKLAEQSAAVAEWRKTHPKNIPSSAGAVER